MTALQCRDKVPGRKCCSDMKGKFKCQHQILRHLWKSFLFFQSFRARRWVHAELAQSLLTRVGQLAVRTACLLMVPRCCRQPAEFTAETHPKKAFFLLQITWQKWARASNTPSSRRWGCPASQHHSACSRGNLQYRGLLTHYAQQKTPVRSVVFTCWPFPSPQSTMVSLHVLLPVWSWAAQRWWCQPKERLSDCWGISLSPSCVNRD